MRMRTILAFLLVVVSLPLSAFDLVVPASGDESYTLLDGDSSFTVDDGIFYKRAFGGKVLAERCSEGITKLVWDGGTLIVMLDADQNEVDSSLYSLSYSTEEPMLLAIGTNVTPDLARELEVETLFSTSSMDPAARARLIRDGVSIMEVRAGDIIQFTEEGISVIDGRSSSGYYIRCPHCGQMIYIG